MEEPRNTERSEVEERSKAIAGNFSEELVERVYNLGACSRVHGEKKRKDRGGRERRQQGWRAFSRPVPALTAINGSRGEVGCVHARMHGRGGPGSVKCDDDAGRRTHGASDRSPSSSAMPT